MKNNVLAHIQSVAPKVSESIDVCLSSTTVSKVNAALAAAKKQTADALASVIEHPQKRSLSSTRKSLTVIDNMLGGLMQGLETRELKVKDFRAVCTNLKTNFIPRLENSLSEEVNKFKAGSGEAEHQSDVELTPEQQEIRKAILAAETIAAEDESEYDRSDKIRQREEEQRRNQLSGITGDVERRLARLRSLITNLPTRLKMPYSIVKVPVAPHFETESAKNPVLLDKLAIPHSEIPLPGLGRDAAHGVVRMERYVIYEQQTILCISKAYVESLLKHKTDELEDENSEEFKEIRARRKDLKAQLAESEEKWDEISAEFAATPSQKDEITRLTDKLKEYNATVDEALKASYTKEELETYMAYRRARAKALSTMNQMDVLLRSYKDNKLTQKEYEEKLNFLLKEVKGFEQTRDTLSIKVEKINRKYAKSADLKKKIEQIGVMERKLQKAQTAESKRSRMIPEAEAKIVAIKKSQERLEEESKAKRKVVKRAGPAVTPEDYARSVLSVINERSETKFDFVSTKPAPNPRNSRDILCYWLMPTTKLSALMRHTGGKAKVMQWDFPFESERHVKPEDERKGWVHPSDDNSHPDFLEFAKNKPHRPSGWKSRYGAPIRKPE